MSSGESTRAAHIPGKVSVPHRSPRERAAEAARAFRRRTARTRWPRIRRAALEVLTVLRELEESARVPLSDGAYDAGSDHSSQSRVASPTDMSDGPSDVSFSVSVMRVGGRRESILVWEEEEEDFNVDGESERLPRERWDKRLVLGSGWLYRSDLKFEDLEKQQRAVAQLCARAQAA